MSYAFFQQGRQDSDPADMTQRNIDNTKYSSYTLYGGTDSRNYVQFATQQPGMIPSGVAHGRGLSGLSVDFDSALLHGATDERNRDGRTQLHQRPFATVPYLGRGAPNPVIESQLQQGENVHGLKSVSTIMEQSFMGYSMYPTDANMRDKVNDPKHTIEEYAQTGWQRGGIDTRITTDDLRYYQNK